jgi:anti-anti-sigma factor
VSDPQVGTAVFRLQGEIDATTALEVRRWLAVAIGQTSVVLDLTEVTTIDTAGVIALRDVMECIYQEGGRTGSLDLGVPPMRRSA